jgi:hypothetical protein
VLCTQCGLVAAENKRWYILNGHRLFVDYVVMFCFAAETALCYWWFDLSAEPVLEESPNLLNNWKVRHVFLQCALLSVEKDNLIKSSLIKTDLKLCCTETHRHAYIGLHICIYIHIYIYMYAYIYKNTH